MSKNPILNGLAASLYIVLVAFVMSLTTRLADKPDTFMAPVAVLSVFTLSAAVMGYLFCFLPIQLYLDGQKKQAVRLFLQTVGVFAGLTLLMIILLFSGVIS